MNGAPLDPPDELAIRNLLARYGDAVCRRDAAAWIAWHDGQLFLQPAADGPPVLCNGSAVKRSTWLREGDVIDIARGRLRLGTTGGTPTLAIEDGSGGNLTLQLPTPGIAGVNYDQLTMGIRGCCRRCRLHRQDFIG